MTFTAVGYRALASTPVVPKVERTPAALTRWPAAAPVRPTALGSSAALTAVLAVVEPVLRGRRATQVVYASPLVRPTALGSSAALTAALAVVEPVLRGRRATTTSASARPTV